MDTIFVCGAVVLALGLGFVLGCVCASREPTPKPVVQAVLSVRVGDLTFVGPTASDVVELIRQVGNIREGEQSA